MCYDKVFPFPDIEIKSQEVAHFILFLSLLGFVSHLSPVSLNGRPGEEGEVLRGEFNSAELRPFPSSLPRTDCIAGSFQPNLFAALILCRL